MTSSQRNGINLWCGFFFVFLNLFIYFWLRWVFVAARGLSLVAASGGYSLSRCPGFSLWWCLLLGSTGSRRVGFSSCGSRAQQLWLVGSRAQAQQLQHSGLVALRQVGSSRTRARTHVPCIGRQILNHCAAREVPGVCFESVYIYMCLQELHGRIRPTEYLVILEVNIGNLKEVLLDNKATVFLCLHNNSRSQKIFHMQIYLNLFMNAFNTLK